MNMRFTTLHIMSSRKYFSVGAVVAVLIAAAGPGEVITITALCNYQQPGGDDSPGAYAECSMVVVSPIFRDTPVYLAQGWQRTVRRKDGSIYTYTDTAAAGLLVRSLVWLDGQVTLADGIMTREGRVLVGSQLLDRADSADAARLYAQGDGR